ncbi:MAG TPA: glycosyltransferase family 4 protein [Anaerolineae bacterium]|nr:glycosyltransferase family 4 protein [Anaerolineae bacterium]
MKILFLSTWFPWPTDNGSKIRVYHLLRALGARHQIELLSFAFDTARPTEAQPLREFCAEVQAIDLNPFKRDDVSAPARFLSPDPIVTRPLTAMTAAVQRRLDSTHYDAVIASIEVAATYAFQAPRTTVKILEEHNSLSRWMWERYRAQTGALQRLRCWLSWRKTARYESRLFRQFDLCTMVSEQDRLASLQMLPHYHGPVEVISNGVDCDRNRPASQPIDPMRLVFSGALTYQANHDAVKYFLEEIYPLIHKAQPEATLSITGSTAGVNLGGLLSSDGVTFTGFVDDIRPIVGGSAVCIVPILEGGGTRLKILEAMALGTPVVSTTKGAEGIEARHGEHLLLADDAVSFAECTVSVMRDPELRRRLASNARRLVEERYDWQKIGQRFAGLIEDVVKRQTT